jgi:type II secretory pathway pseudopilin PulG
VLLIIFPKLVGSTRGAKEDGLRGSLQQMRMAIMCFKSDTGHYPIILDDLVALSPADVKTKIKPGTYKGPYLFTEGGIGGDGPPRNPFISGRDTVVAHHWKYNAKTGTVTVPDSMAARTRRSDNKRYDQL